MSQNSLQKQSKDLFIPGLSEGTSIRLMEDLPLFRKRVFIRVDFNVSFDAEGKILDDTRVRAALPTIDYALSKQAKVILASHLGRPKGKVDPKYSLMPVAEHLANLMNREVVFPEDCVGSSIRKLAYELKEGQILLLENLRFHSEEEKNDPSFSEKLASLAEVYINDAFGALHRAHASTVGMTRFFDDRGIGFLVKKEMDYLVRVLERPERPFVAILGGSKISDKLGVIESLLSRVDALLVGGAMAYTFLKAEGVQVGRSLVEESQLALAASLLRKARMRGIPILLPVDHQIAPSLESPSLARIMYGNIPYDEMGLDIGPATLEIFKKQLLSAKTILWNGPMGAYETPPFNRGSVDLAELLAKSDALVVVGGGDSAAAVVEAGVADQIDHISTGGGATLEFLEGKVLPGLKALEVPALPL